MKRAAMLRLACALVIVQAAAILFCGSARGADAAVAPGGIDSDTAALAARIVILANAHDDGSLRVARHYAERRGVPEENIIAMPMSDTETISWQTFVAEIWEPLMRELVARKWVEQAGSEVPVDRDADGRTMRVILGHRISYLVVCRGVPLRIANDPSLVKPNLPSTFYDAFKTTQGAVDGELAALALGNYPITGFVNNALFLVRTPSRAQENLVVKVARLDGPDVVSALALVDNAMKAEVRVREHPEHRGRAYVDLGGGVSKVGNEWLERVARDFEQAGFKTVVDRAEGTFPADTPFEEPMFYFGWYAQNVCGPFVRVGFRFPPGAVALHIHSFSATTLRSASQGWCGPFVARGVTATFGNVFEPFLNHTHHPYAIVEALLRGARMGDATFYALPSLSWQEVFVGDPLYRPCPLAAENAKPLADLQTKSQNSKSP